MQELNHNPKGETESLYMNAPSESCQLANRVLSTNNKSHSTLFRPVVSHHAEIMTISV